MRVSNPIPASFRYCGVVAVILATLSLLAIAESAVAQDKYATAAELKLMEGFPPPADKRVTKATALQTPPFNRWSYLNMRLFYPTAPVKSASKAIPLQTSIDWSLDNELRIEVPKASQTANLATYLRHSYADAMVVVRGDKIVYEKYLNNMHADQPHQMMSVTKSFCGLLGLMAVDDGDLEEDELASKYVPELAKSGAFGDATVGQILDMTNSMKFAEDYADPRSGIRIYGATVGWTAKVDDIQYKDSLYEYLPTLDIDEEHKHGEIFHYQTPKTDVVNWLTNRATGQSFQEGLYEKLWSKIGTSGETYVLLDNNATLVAGGGLNATPHNLARFAMMMINNGKFHGRQVVPSNVIRTIAKGASIEAFDNGPDSDGYVHPKGEWSYRGQWWIKHTKGKDAFMAIGIHGQWIYLDANHKIAIIKLSSQPKSKDDYLNKYDLNAFDAIVDYLCTSSAD